MKPRNRVPGALRRTDSGLSTRIAPTWIVLLLSALCLLSTGCGSDSGAAEGETTYLQVPTRSTQPIRDGQFEFILSAVETGITRLGGPTSGRDADGKFTVVRVQVTNTGDTRSVFDYSFQQLLDDTAATRQADLVGSMVLNGEFRHEYAPGVATTVQLAFDLPADATPTALVMHAFEGSPGARIALS